MPRSETRFKANFGVLVISHGSSNEGWIRRVDEAVQAIRRPQDLPIYSSFLEMVEGRTIQDGIHALEAEGVTDLIIIPLFISAGSSHIEEIQIMLGVQANQENGSVASSSEPRLKPEHPENKGLGRLKFSARVHWTSPIGDCGPIAHLLLQKLEETSLNPENEIVLVVGHGSDLEPGYIRWKQDLNGLAARVRRLGGFAAAEGVTLLPDELKPRLDYWAKQEPKLTVLLAPLFVSPGYFTEKVIPRRAAEYEYRYNGKALLPSPMISRWMEEQIASILQ